MTHLPANPKQFPRPHLLLLLLTLAAGFSCTRQEKTFFVQDGNSLVFTGEPEYSCRLRLTPYGDGMLRVQYATPEEDFFADDHYEMVAGHDWPGRLNVAEQDGHYAVTLEGREDFVLRIDKASLQLDYRMGEASLLRENAPYTPTDSLLSVSFAYDPAEHFTGLGHGYYGRSESIDLRGQTIRRNYGSYHAEQAPLLVPFYLSSKGYGVFLNSTFPNIFNFGENQEYAFGIETAGFEGQMDYFFILGPSFPELLDRYTQLTGRPRLPQRSIFGLQLSDKAHDHTSPTPSDEQWWRRKITAHREAGFPLDHVVNDNRWRAGGGKRCQSQLDWDPQRYPDPAAYEDWLNEQGLTATLDFNRCIGQFSEGWKPAFNIPVTDSISFPESAPDLTDEAFRKWFWNIFYQKSLNPELDFPGDALWIDEFDEMGNAPGDMMLSNGRSFFEMRNYWFFLIAKALVQEGWDRDIGPAKRPYVWVRGMSAGAQRYATLWSGDIKPNYRDMRTQIRGMQLAGLSGFPFWGHDAGGFYDWDLKTGPNEALYRHWGMAFGSFAPIWKPHGMGRSRWPLDRSPAAQRAAKTYGDLRYSLMPYTYSCAYRAHATGLPIARAMVIDYPDSDKAWQYDLQYLWGSDILVAPQCDPEKPVEVWLPEGQWYDFWTDELIEGDQVLTLAPEGHQMPLFVKAGGVIPRVEAARSTAFLDEDRLVIHVYTGADGQFTLHEDDGVSEQYRTDNRKRETRLRYQESPGRLTIAAAKGSFAGASEMRDYHLIFHGVDGSRPVSVNEEPLVSNEGLEEYATYNPDQRLLHVFLVDRSVEVEQVVEW